MRIRLVVLLIGIAFLLSCIPHGDDPVGTVKSFVSAINNRDFTKAQKLITEGYMHQLETLKKKPADLYQKTIVTRYTLREKRDSVAIVDLLLQPIKNIPETSLQAHLKKRNGKWLIEAIF